MNKLPLLLACLAGIAEAATYSGAPIETVLEQLRANGVQLLYSSDLIKPWMRVEHEPAAIEPKALLAEILAPHGIAVADGPDGAPVARAAAIARATRDRAGFSAPPGAVAARTGHRQRESLPVRH